MSKTQEDLVREEQTILNNLIRDMDKTLLQLDKKLTYNQLQAQKARTSCLPDTYGMLVSAEHEKLVARQQIRELRQGRDELYETRLVLDITDEQGCDREDIKIGLHTYLNGKRIFVMSWKMPLCRHYILDNSAEEYDGVVIGKHGEKYKTHYQLQLKRQVNMFFDTVKSVTHFFPTMDEEAEQIIADEFLQELLNRRSSQEFKNIVFSIQKKQGEIIQTPFKQDLIVQGCAGSGKSMIMLHRLPIVIYDNPNSLDRNNLYIITPSIAYIQMANNMRIDLEIEDLKMGTLEQYYNHVLEKYNISSEKYGTIKPYIRLNQANLKYIYSSECVKDIHTQIEEIIEAGEVDYKAAYEMLNLKEVTVGKVAVTPSDKIHEKTVKIQTVLNQNDVSLRSYHRNVFELLTQLNEFVRLLETRKIAVTRGIAKQIAKEEKIIAEKEREISKIRNREAHEMKYQNCLNFIKVAQNKIADLNKTQEIVELDEDYFDMLKTKAQQIRQMLDLFVIVKSERIDMSLDEQYQMIADKGLLCINCNEIIKEASLMEDPYREYVESIVSGTKKVEQSLTSLVANDSLYLPKDYLKKLLDTNKYYSEAANNTVQNIYLSLMKDLGQEPDEKGKLDALECSPYLYLQILYQFSGAPNSEKESLITIDEAQNISPEELRLIKAVNGNRVVLNLFGDVKQHVEGEKGIDAWNMISDIAHFKKEYMRENYRNARQITEYCNKRFKLNMRAINLDGTGVHEIKNEIDFESTFLGIFQKPQNVGLSCIIVKNASEADELLARYGMYISRIHDMTKESVELHRTKWNLMTVEQSKGLEFETVFAVTGRMSENEKYITYTRALDELYVYDEEIKLSAIPIKTGTAEKTDKRTKEKSSRKKREKRNSKETTDTKNNKGLKEFFEKNGLKVIDDRKKSGHLWVIGSKNEIDSIVNEAIEIYNITGNYGSGKVSGFKEGWFTKSKK